MTGLGGPAHDLEPGDERVEPEPPAARVEARPDKDGRKLVPRCDPLIAALARYVEALHRRYPEGPDQMRRDGLDGRANITGMQPPKKDTAA